MDARSMLRNSSLRTQTNEVLITKTLGSESQNSDYKTREVIEFLLQYYNHLFSYDFTKNLESKLDCIASAALHVKQYAMNVMRHLKIV